jgi:tetratricopeptide (TPR) repeat protein
LQLLPIHVFLPRYDVANDRHLYLAGWSLLLPVAALFGQLRAGLRFAAIAMLSLGLAVLSISRNNDYRSEIALWESTVARSPNKSRAHNNLGYAYFLAGRTQDAEQAYLTAIRLDPGNLRAQNNLVRIRTRP